MQWTYETGREERNALGEVTLRFAQENFETFEIALANLENNKFKNYLARHSGASREQYDFSRGVFVPCP